MEGSQNQPIHLAILVYGEINTERNALAEEKYKDLADTFINEGYVVHSILYNDLAAEKLEQQLLNFQVVLVWINPIEKGKDRKILDELLVNISNNGCYVSAHPNTILKIGTKEVLYATREMGWGSQTNLYRNFEQFKNEFPKSLSTSEKRVLKQYRGNGGNGVFKVSYDPDDASKIKLTHAQGNIASTYSINDFLAYFQPYILEGGLLIDQPWNDNFANGMVRCYLTGNKVAGFGYQEINALYETVDDNYILPSKRYYFTENCGLFLDLKETMENKWVPQLQKFFSIPDDRMPVIWDADFFISNESSPLQGKYKLCEINASSVSPFPPSAIKFIVKAINDRFQPSA